MSILDNNALNDLKWNYNYNLNRFYKGCSYCEKHKKEADKWLPQLLDILDNINSLLDEIMQNQEVTEEEILNGFKITE